MVRWLGAVCPPVDGSAAHVDHVLLSTVDILAADLVCTHADHTGAVARTVMTARLNHEPTAAVLAELADRLGLPAVWVAGPPEGARCVRFPGQEALTGVHSAAEIVAASAIDEVVGIGVAVDSPIDTRGFLRPTFTEGRLVLLVEQAAGGVLRPVEIAAPHQCCGGH
ncbi:hypothetical protein [Actinophytocola sp.]|uniref:hypothetical protein n=1 Tax=Actinophytocola sp. TaxID=1872138 RepID=UPI002ED4218B